MVPHDSLLPVVVTTSSSNYSVPSELQINIDERLIDFYNRFVVNLYYKLPLPVIDSDIGLC